MCSEIGNGELEFEYKEVSNKAVDTIINKLKNTIKMEKGIPIGYEAVCTPRKVEFMITSTKNSFEGKKFLVMYDNTGKTLDIGYNDEPYSFSFESENELDNFLEKLS